MAKMEKRAYVPYLAVIGLMALTSLALAFSVNVQISDRAGVRAELPDRVGGWTGTAILYCLEQSCQRELRGGDQAEDGKCPHCGGTLSSMSYLEARLLPADTVLNKKRYTNAAGRVVYASIVISGRERASIHRPEVCLVGQGTEIVNQTVIDVPLDGRDPLRVKVLDLLHRSGSGAAQHTVASSYYAYWFVGLGRETPEHWQRMWWMATDRVLHNIAHRWAYISVTAMRADDSDAHLDDARAFIRDLYPQMLIDPAAGGPG